MIDTVYSQSCDFRNPHPASIPDDRICPLHRLKTKESSMGQASQNCRQMEKVSTLDHAQLAFTGKVRPVMKFISLQDFVVQ